MAEVLWIAQIHVRPRSRSSALSKGAKGAYVNAVTLATGVSNFRAKVRREASEYGLLLVEVEDAETFEHWCEGHEVSDEIQALADSIQAPNQVLFDAFYEYFADDDTQ